MKTVTVEAVLKGTEEAFKDTILAPSWIKVPRRIKRVEEPDRAGNCTSWEGRFGGHWSLWRGGHTSMPPVPHPKMLCHVRAGRARPKVPCSICFSRAGSDPSSQTQNDIAGPRVPLRSSGLGASLSDQDHPVANRLLKVQPGVEAFFQRRKLHLGKERCRLSCPCCNVSLRNSFFPEKGQDYGEPMLLSLDGASQQSGGRVSEPNLHVRVPEQPIPNRLGRSIMQTGRFRRNRRDDPMPEIQSWKGTLRHV